MRYDNLHQLIQGSSSTRRYFLSLPADMQCRLHAQGEHIHFAQQLHDSVRAAEVYRRQLHNSDYYNFR